DRARRILLAALPPKVSEVADWERLPRSRRRVAPAVEPGRRAASEQSSRAGGEEILAGSVPAAVLFYLVLTAIGLAAFALTYVLFPKMADRGAGLARVIGVALATYV